MYCIVRGRSIVTRPWLLWSISKQQCPSIESRQLSAPISNNANNVFCCQQAERGESDTAVECTEKDDRVENDKGGETLVFAGPPGQIILSRK